MPRKPRPLIAIAVLSLASELAVLPYPFRASSLVRIALYALVLFLALRGNRGAANLWGALSVVGAAVTGYGALGAARSNSTGAAFLAVYAAFFVASAVYIFKSRNLARFYEQSQSAGATRRAI